MERYDDSRLSEFRQLRQGIRQSGEHMVVGIDIAKDRHRAFFGTPTGRTLLRKVVFENTKEGFEKLLFHTDILMRRHVGQGGRPQETKKLI